MISCFIFSFLSYTVTRGLCISKSLRGGIKTKNADNVRVFGEFQTPPPPPKTRTFFVFFSPIFCWFLGDGVQIRDPKHSFLAFPESVQKVVGSISKIGQFFDHLNF